MFAICWLVNAAVATVLHFVRQTHATARQTKPEIVQSKCNSISIRAAMNIMPNKVKSMHIDINLRSSKAKLAEDE